MNTHIILLSFCNLNKDRHQLVELVQSNDLQESFFCREFGPIFCLISVLVKEVEDPSQVILHLARAEQIEKNQHVRHCWGEKTVTGRQEKPFTGER